MVRLTLAYAAGAAWALMGAPIAWAPPLALLYVVGPRSTSSRPARHRLVWVSVAGLALWTAVAGRETRSCREVYPAGDLQGRFLSSPRHGSAPFLASSGCGQFTAVVSDSTVEAGRLVTLSGTWREGRFRPWLMARVVDNAAGPGDRFGSGSAPAATPAAAPAGDPAGGLRWAIVRWRDGLVDRLEALYGPRAPLVAALTLARTEGFDPELRDMFARVGLAHILSISGFHVGIIAAVALALLRTLGMSVRRARLGTVLFAWLYVGLIGFPDAACRAALILALVAASRARSRPPARWGALAGAFLVLLVVDPAKLAGAGFQLSFAGAAGLVAWSEPVGSAIRRLTRGRCPRPIVTGLASGIAATAATLPIAAYHFERIALIGIPATMIAGPLVALALPGAIASLAIDFVWPELARFLAGGVSLLLEVFEQLARIMAGWSWASVWTTRHAVLAAFVGLVCAAWLAARPGIGPRGRRAMTAAYVLAMIIGWPLLLALQGRGTVEIVMIDVGQGDAIALRSPRGRWVLVDAGPPEEGSDPRAHPVVRELREHAVDRLDALVITHPHLDHFGGVPAVLESFEVGAVYDPAIVTGDEAFVDLLRLADARAIPWRAARTGDRLALDGMVLTVLSPSAPPASAEADPNESSVVIHLSYGAFDALLTGDAYKGGEREWAPALDADFEILKAGHHGSDTSTDSVLIADTRPDVALISVGRSNRYGHPSPAVLARLRRAGVRVHRTDREGAVTVLGRADGTFTVFAERAPAP